MTLERFMDGVPCEPVINVLEKRCPKCGETKPLSEYHKHKSMFMGVQGHCKTCNKGILKQWDKDTHKADGRCYHCQLNYELDLKFDKPIRWFAYRRLKELINMDAIHNDMEKWVFERDKILKQNPFDKKVANAMANSEVELTINKNKAMS